MSKAGSIREIGQKIKKARSIAVVCHINPDGDCIGSLLALGLGLASIGKRVYMVSQDGVPKRYSRLPGANKIKKGIDELPDMAITVDCNAKEMVGEPFSAVIKAKDILEIDHHEYRRSFGNLSLIDTRAAAVGELVYSLLKYLDINISEDIAQSILTSIIVETNSFRLPTVTPRTFNITAELLKTGVDFHRLTELVYWFKTKEVAMFSGACMSKLKFLENDEIAWSIITRGDFSRIKGKDEDVDAVTNDIISINTVKIAVLFREKSPNLLRVSLRSKGGIDIAQLAYAHNGGGHFDSAGCHIENKKGAIAGIMKEAEELLRRGRT